MPAGRGKYRKCTYNSRSIFAKNIPKYLHILRSASRYYGEVLDIRFTYLRNICILRLCLSEEEVMLIPDNKAISETHFS